MNLRSKTVGIVSALALSITMGAGIASAADSSTGTSATLADATPGNGCTSVITAGGNVNFGTFEWDGSAYTGTAGSGSITVTRADERAPGAPACDDAQVSATDLMNGANVAFSATDISLTVGANAAFPLSTTATSYADLAPKAVTTASVTVAGVPDSVPTGVYTGTITISQNAGQ